MEDQDLIRKYRIRIRKELELKCTTVDVVDRATPHLTSVVMFDRKNLNLPIGVMVAFCVSFFEFNCDSEVIPMRVFD